MNKIELKKGDTSDNGQIIIIDEDRLCYLVKSISRGAFGLRTISKELLSEYVAYFDKHPDATANDAREALSGNSDIDKFEYGYSSTLRVMAQMVLGQISTTTSTIEITHKTKSKLAQPLQQIFYGAPGTGKSHEVKRQTGELLDSGEERDLPNVFRTTFHPDTDYASFVGCYKPTMKPTSKEEKTLTGKDEEIVYEFVPQAFTDAYFYAYTHSTEQTYLVIEEINRGNCAQIFGDLFQLLDRKGGVSEYKIKADKDLANYLVDELGEDSEGINEGKLCLPSNLNILATMNTSDQSLFPMDSAFKRRWEWEYVPINYSTGIKSGTFEITIGEKTYLWVDFIKEANKKIFDLTQSEDKQLGNFFIKHSVDEKEFKSKVMFYLWYEVLRDETENNKYFFYKKTTIDGKEEIGKFIFKDLYEQDATQTLQQFMEYLGVAPNVAPK